ncbi:Na+/H+ antiporter subunit D [Skermanella rosea]|uniref:Na+/H+ antiporter subunit D n=1 Tax=Skermanella rosea TaxID=1817965 RepID=UPI001E33AC10|nr:Na+/H+ antiporter subunit D [Skermanella rosea]UEM04472.1 Na+/H+ antiporter subunit D [Skermanella rosea]
MSWYLIAPILVPMTTAVLAIMLWNSRAAQRAVSAAGAGLHLVSAILLMAKVWQGGILAGQMGGWPAPFGITLVADHLSAVMVLITGIMGLGVGLYSLSDINEDRERNGFHPLYHVLLTGVTGAFITGDLFNLYVWFEVMLIASFALLALGAEKEQLDGAIKYAAINVVATVMFLIAVGILYGLTGTLNMADLAVRLPQVEQQGLVTTVAVLFMITFGIKSAVFPLFFWLPASYHTPAVAVSAIFAGLLTKVGVYALVRTFTLIFTGDVAYTHTALLVVAGLTMVTGVLGAAAQNEIRRILSFHIISQIGYMVMGLALYTPLGLIGAVFYLVHHIIVKTNLFLVAGVAKRLTGSMELKKIGGLYKASPLLAVLFLIPALSLGGIPPLSGFWAKLVLIRASLEIGSYAIAATAILVGLLTMFSMTKIWGEAFWKPHPGGDARVLSISDLTRTERTLLIGPIVVFAALTVAIGLWTQPFLDLATRASAELLAPAPYIEAVLGPQAGVPGAQHAGAQP